MNWAQEIQFYLILLIALTLISVIALGYVFLLRSLTKQESDFYKRLFFILLLTSLTLFFILGLWNIFLPFLLGLLIAYLLDPFVVLLEKNKFYPIKRSIGVSVIFLIFTGIFVSLPIIFFEPVIREAEALIKNIPKYTDLAEKEFYNLLKQLSGFGFEIKTDDIRQELFKEGKNYFTYFLSSLQTFFTSIVNQVFYYLLVVPLSTFYFLSDKEKIFDTIKKYTTDEKELKIRQIFDEVNKKIGGYIKGQFVTSLVVAISVTTCLFFFDKIPTPILLGLVAGLANVIPYFGPIIGASPPIIIAIANYDAMKEVLVLTIFFVALNVLVAVLIQPKIMSKTVNIHPLIVILAVFVGNALYGVVGMLIAVPLAIIVKVLIQSVFDRYIIEI